MKGIMPFRNIRDQGLQPAGIGNRLIQQNIDLTNECLLQHVEHQLYRFRSLRNRTIGAAKSREVTDCSIHAGEEQGVAQQHFQCDYSIEAIDPDIFSGQFICRCQFSLPFCQLMAGSKAPHKGKALSL